MTEISETAGSAGEGESERERKRRAGKTLVSGVDTVDDSEAVAVVVVAFDDNDGDGDGDGDGDDRGARADKREGDKAASTRLTEA